MIIKIKPIYGTEPIETTQIKETSISFHKTTAIYNSEKISSKISQKETTS